MFRLVARPSTLSSCTRRSHSLLSIRQSSSAAEAPRQSTTSLNDQRVIFSGIQPTGIPHLGNYLGALRQWVKIQNQASEIDQLYYCIVDYHAITIKQDPEYFRQWRKEALIALLAVGLDPKRSTLFYQSSVSFEVLFICNRISNVHNVGESAY
jgi:tryptophanyl-tRNA synthetase